MPVGARRQSWALLAALFLSLAGAAGCRSVRSDEALAMLEVSATAGLPSFTTARFSVAGRPEIPPHEVRYDGRGSLKFGYYLPGPGGTLRISVQALSASCLVGSGSAEVDVQLGRVSPSVALLIKPLEEPDPSCATPRDAGPDSADGGGGDSTARDAIADVDTGPRDTDGDGDVRPIDAPVDTALDAPGDAVDAAPVVDAGADGVDATPARDAPVDVVADALVEMMSMPPPPPPPACMAATKACPGASECCSGLVCGNTTLGRVCCGNYNMTCTRAGGEDCCGQLECVSGRCCLPATYACSGGSCCPGLVCGNTTLGRVCCGNAGASCKRADGADCCGALECVNGVCR